VGGFTFVWEQVTVWAAAGIQRVVLDMEHGVGQLVDNVYFAGTHAPPRGFRLSSVSTGNYFTCGLDPKGRAWCWGSDNGGFLGNDTLIAGSLKPVVVAGGGGFSQLDAGADFTCALRSTQPWCWGGNAWGQIAAPAFTTCVVNGVTLPCNPTPAAVPAKGFVTISAGSLHACALDGAGQAFCWGWNPNGELGHTSTATCTLATQTVPCSTVPTAVAPGPAGPLSFVAISAGAQHTCALDKGGQAYCWGANYAGEFGNGSSSGPHMSPVPGPKLLFSAISAGNGFTCGLESGTSVPYCWGQNASGQLGDGTTNASLTPVPVAGGKAFRTLSVIRAGLWYTCGLTTAGRAYCWGRNNSGQLGDGTAIEKHLPVPVGGGLTWASLATLGSGDANHTCAIATTTSETYCWGQNTYGQLGNGTTGGSMTPVKVVP
jgi:alpha-tubulin suppressor-like RCC1 family protein